MPGETPLVRILVACETCSGTGGVTFSGTPGGERYYCSPCFGSGRRWREVSAWEAPEMAWPIEDLEPHLAQMQANALALAKVTAHHPIVGQ